MSLYFPIKSTTSLHHYVCNICNIKLKIQNSQMTPKMGKEIASCDLLLTSYLPEQIICLMVGQNSLTGQC